jgi:acyl carrier protein
MEKTIIEKKLIQILQKKTNVKLKNVSKNDDLYIKGIVDSFDMLSILSETENKFNCKIKLEKIKDFKFSVNFLTKVISNKLNK